MSRSIKTLVLALAFTALAQPAFSAPVHYTVTHVKVFYGDLNLRNEVGARTLLRRINKAAWRACGYRPAGMTLDAQARFKACRADAVRAAVKKVNQPLLTALYAGTRPAKIAGTTR